MNISNEEQNEAIRAERIEKMNAVIEGKLAVENPRIKEIYNQTYDLMCELKTLGICSAFYTDIGFYHNVYLDKDEDVIKKENVDKFIKKANFMFMTIIGGIYEKLGTIINQVIFVQGGECYVWERSKIDLPYRADDAGEKWKEGK